MLPQILIAIAGLVGDIKEPVPKYTLLEQVERQLQFTGDYSYIYKGRPQRTKGQEVNLNHSLYYFLKYQSEIIEELAEYVSQVNYNWNYEIVFDQFRLDVKEEQVYITISWSL